MCDTDEQQIQLNYVKGTCNTYRISNVAYGTPFPNRTKEHLNRHIVEASKFFGELYTDDDSVLSQLCDHIKTSTNPVFVGMYLNNSVYACIIDANAHDKLINLSNCMLTYVYNNICIMLSFYDNNNEYKIIAYSMEVQQVTLHFNLSVFDKNKCIFLTKVKNVDSVSNNATKVFRIITRFLKTQCGVGSIYCGELESGYSANFYNANRFEPTHDPAVFKHTIL